MQGQFSFPPEARIRKRGEFDAVQAKGTRVSSRHFIFLIAAADSTQSRIGFIITRKAEPSSVRRNRMRRRLREIFRNNRQKLTKKIDLVIIARKGAAQREYGEIREEVLGVLSRGGYFPKLSFKDSDAE